MIPDADTLKTVGVALLLITAALAAVSPVAAANGSGGDGVVSEELRDASSWSSFDVPDDAVTYGVEGYPGVIVHYSEGDGDALQQWANESDKRSIHYRDNASSWATVSAPAEHLGLTDKQRVLPSVFGSGLAQQSYVEHLELNRMHSYAEPVSRLESEESAFSKPAWGDVATLYGLKGDFDQSGVAYQDVNETTMQEAREYHGADSTGYTGAGVTVGVVDTGLNYNEDLYQDRVVAGYNAISDTEANITLDGDGTANVSQSDYSALSETNLHGSFVSSQILADTSGTNASYMGVAPGAHLISVRALNDEGSGSSQDIAEGIEYACEGGADVVSLSLGTFIPQETIATEISECYQEDGVSAVVVATGNSRQTTRWVAYPAQEAAEEPVIGVAALSGAQPSAAESAYFSNVGPHPANGATPTVGATGMQVTAQLDDGSGTLHTRTLSGTSMATPIVSGVLAQALEADSSLQGEELEIRNRVERTSSPVPAAGTSEVGSGSINASNLITDTQPAETQEEVRSTGATARDSANDAVSGSKIREILGA